MKTLEQVRASLKPYPVEVEFPDIRCWKTSNCGVDYVHSFDSGMPGPHVMIMALTHGNEVSGAIAVDAFLRSGLRPRRGRLSLGFGNVEAYHHFNPQSVDSARYLDEDMNRVWIPSRLDSDQNSIELRRARELRPLIDSVDLLLDIHSMHEESAPLMMSGPCSKGLEFAADIGVPATVIVDYGHANGCRMRDYGDFSDSASGKNALLVETGQHFSKKSSVVALDVAARFLITTQVAREEDVARFISSVKAEPQRFLHVTDAVVAKSMGFSFVGDFRGLELIGRSGTVIAHDGDQEIVTPYDNCVLVQPSVRHLGLGVTLVRLARVLDISHQHLPSKISL